MRFTSDKRGASVVMTALMLPVILGFVGLGLDVGMWYTTKRDMQAATDSAAISAALTYIASHNVQGAKAIATDDAVRNGFNDDTGSIEINLADIDDDEEEIEEKTAEVIITEPQRLYFSSVLMSEPIQIRTRAVASATALPGEHCIVALDPSADGAITFTGTAVASINCGVASNSVSNESVLLSGSAILTADPVDTAGDISIGGSATLNTETPPKLGGTVPDPYEDLEVPTTPVACITEAELPNGVNVNNNNGVTTNANNITLVPGRYCNGLKLTNASNLTFAPGVYIIDEGEFETVGSTSMHGTGVTFILTGSGTSYATLKFAGGTNAQLSAPTTGPYAGILFYQDRNAPSFQGSTLIDDSILGGSETDFTGVIYFPKQEVLFTGGSAVGGTNSCLHIIARKVTITGNAALGSECEGTGVEPISRMVVKLIE